MKQMLPTKTPAFWPAPLQIDCQVTFSFDNSDIAHPSTLSGILFY
jgi:hypothetical protein